MRHRLLLFALLLVVLAAAAQPVSAAIVNISVGPGNSFSPKTPTINVGDTVRWTLVGGTHNVNSDTGLFRSGNPSSNWPAPFDVPFNSAGTFGYHCEQHGSPGSAMFGTITVVGGGGNPGTLQFSTGSSSVSESAGSKTITVTRVGGDNGAASVHFATANGSATAGSDYTATSGQLDWADHDDNPKTFTVNITDDSVEEGNETIVLTLSAATGATLGSPSTATLTINANDTPTGGPGTIRFTSATASVSESQANVTLTAERTGGSTGPVSVAVNTANGTATAGTDYQAISNGTLTWGNGDSANKTLVIPIVGDTTEEPSETFTATLSAPTGGAAIGNIPTATVTISDDDISCEPCVADDTTLCLAGGSGDPNRFRVRVTWTDFAGASGPGKAVPFTPDAGFFYFFNNPNNLELLVKMVRGCGTSLNAYWFFYAAASNVGLEYEVLDTTRCVTKTYSNEVGNCASFGDINARATCS